MTPFGPSLPDLSERDLQDELMDDPRLEAARHERALDALQRVNRVSLVANRVWNEVRTLGRRADGPVQVLDVACGGGDVLHAVGRRAARAGLPVRLRGCDRSPVALDRARRSAPRGLDIDFVELDALTDDLPGPSDLVTTSLFLHHLERSDAVTLLRRMAEASEAVLLVQDLRRTRLGYLFAWIGAHTLTGSDVVRVDGPRSVRGAFTTDEVRSICSDAGLSGAAVENRWPQRFTIRWLRG